MRKLFVLVAALLLVGLVAGADGHTSLSGEVEMRWLQDLGAKAFSEVGDNVAVVKLDVDVDDTASVYIEWEEGSSQLGDVTLANTFDRAHFTLDLGAIFDLPVGVELRTGFDEWKLFDAVKVTPSEQEDKIGSDAKAWGHKVEIAATEQVSLRGFFANDPGLEAFGVGLAVDYAPVYVEAGYVNLDATEIGDGDLEAGVQFATEVADGIEVAAAGTFDYDLSDTATEDAIYEFGFGVALTYNEMVTLGVILNGMTDYAANYVQVDLEAMPVEAVTVNLFVGIGLEEDNYPETFDSLEGSATFMIGPAKWTAGMVYVPDGGTNEADEKSDFQDTAADGAAIFMRAKLEY